MNTDQDWTTVVFRKKKTATATTPNKGNADATTVTVKKVYGGTNTNKNNKGGESSHLRKIADTEIAKVERVSPRVRQAIAKARTAKNLSQKDLAIRLNVKQGVIRDYENGTAIPVPDGRFIARLEKILETTFN
jgi:putative transcription factor